MKGQVLVVIAVVVSLVVLLIGIEADYVSSLHRKEVHTGKDIVNTLENLKEEYLRLVEISLSEEPTLFNLNRNIMDFSAFVDKNLPTKQSLLFYSASEAKEDELKIVVGNFLSEDIVNVSITQNLTGEDATINEIGRGGTETVDFNVSSGSPGDYNVDISYMGESSRIIYNEGYMGKIDTEKRFVVYYRLKIFLDNSYVKDKFQINQDLKG